MGLLNKTRLFSSLCLNPVWQYGTAAVVVN